MMLPERWLIVAVVGLTVPLVSLAGGSSSGQQSDTGQSSTANKSSGGQSPAPARAVVDPDAPAPDDPQAQPAKRDDDLAPEADDDQAGEKKDATQAQEGTHPSEQSKRAIAPSVIPHGAEVSPGAAPSSGSEVIAVVKTQEVEGHGKYDKETKHLLDLIQDLKAEVDKAGTNMLSLAALRKADEIQRVAKDLKAKMREQGTPVTTRR
jgi:hypothetical protein